MRCHFISIRWSFFNLQKPFYSLQPIFKLGTALEWNVWCENVYWASRWHTNPNNCELVPRANWNFSSGYFTYIFTPYYFVLLCCWYFCDGHRFSASSTNWVESQNSVLPLPLALSFARSRESKWCPNTLFDWGVGLRRRGIQPSVFGSLLETECFWELTWNLVVCDSWLTCNNGGQIIQSPIKFNILGLNNW